MPVQQMSNFVASQLPLAPLGAGDLIDRAVRLYRRHLFTLIRIAAPPVIISAIGWVCWNIAWPAVFVTPSRAWLAFYFFVGAMGVALIVETCHTYKFELSIQSEVRPALVDWTFNLTDFNFSEVLEFK